MMTLAWTTFEIYFLLNLFDLYDVLMLYWLILPCSLYYLGHFESRLIWADDGG